MVTNPVDEIAAELEAEFERVVPAPSNPMKVARALVADLYTGGDELVLGHHRGDFYHFDGACWPETEARGIRGAIYRWLERAAYQTKDGLVSFDPTRRKVDDVVDALRAVVHVDGSIEPPAWLDGAADPPATEIAAVGNGLLHIPTRKLLTHTPNFFAHHSLPFDFDADAPRPARWLSFLEELWGDDKDSISTLQEVFGYIIGGDTRQQKIVLLIGPKRSGKGTIGRVITGLLGRHNVAAPTLAGMATNFGLSPLVDRPLALISDARLSTRADTHVVVERLLSVSGEDSLTIDRKYRDPWTGRLPTRFVVLSNELPNLSDSSGALSSRFVLLVLTRSFYGQENPRLTEDLLTEAPGILNWSLEGLDRLEERGYFEQPASGIESLRQLEDLSSSIATFVRESCCIGPDQEVAVDDLWGAWKSWCDEADIRRGTKATFGRDLKAAVPTIHKARPREDETRSYRYVGIALGSGDNTGLDLGPPGPPPLGPSGPSKLPADNASEARPGPSGPRTNAMYSPQDAESQQDDGTGFGAFTTCSYCERHTYHYIGGKPICATCKAQGVGMAS